MTLQCSIQYSHASQFLSNSFSLHCIFHCLFLYLFFRIFCLFVRFFLSFFLFFFTSLPLSFLFLLISLFYFDLCINSPSFFRSFYLLFFSSTHFYCSFRTKKKIFDLDFANNVYVCNLLLFPSLIMRGL